MERLEQWMEAYTPNLRRAVTERPDEYAFGLEGVPRVADRMRAAFERGSYNHDGHAIKWTCKALGIPHTRKAICAFLAGGAQ